MKDTSGFFRRLGMTFAMAVLLAGMSTVSAQQAGRQLATRTLRTMSRAYMAYGHYDKAQALAERAVIQARRDGAQVGEMALCLIDLGTVYSYENRLDDAASLLTEGVSLQQQALGQGHPYTAHTLRLLSDVYRRQDKLDAAESALGEAFSVMLAHTQIQSREMTPFLIASAQLAAAAGRYENALQTYHVAQQMALVSFGPDHLYTAQIMQGTAEAAMACGQLDQAREQINYSMQIQDRYFGESPAMLISGWLAKARIERACGMIGQSEAYLAKAIAAAQQGNNIITLSRVYEQVRAIRTEGVLTASASSL